MIEPTDHNTLLLFAVAIITLMVSIVRLKKTIANNQAPMNSQSIVSLLLRNGISSSANGPWIIFNYQGSEYTINTSKLPVLFVLKQTSLEGFQEYSAIYEDVARSISLDIPLTSIRIDGDPAKRAIFQVNAVENCMNSFVQRLSIYLELLNEAEAKFFTEIVRNKQLH